MEQPDICPEPMYDLMIKSWSHYPDNRPSFAEIIDLVDNILKDHVAVSILIFFVFFSFVDCLILWFVRGVHHPSLGGKFSLYFGIYNFSCVTIETLFTDKIRILIIQLIKMKQVLCHYDIDFYLKQWILRTGG